MMWLVFLSSYADEWEDHSNNWGSLLGSLNVPLGVLFNLQIEDQGLVEFDLSAILDPFDFNWFVLCPWAMPFCQKLCLAAFLLFMHFP